MSAHDRAAANHARRFTLGVSWCDDQCSQSWEIPRLTAAEVEDEKRHYSQMYAGRNVHFYVETA